MLLALAAAIPIVERLRAAITITGLVILGIELNRLALARDSEGHP
ncbi:MAG TPA: hypothetical protein VGP82_06900 [Ktedonobacterales bacterium]|jgi:hypothetical protein|nr:hypothetical protein [Ktedonobacterales bacterium]